MNEWKMNEWMKEMNEWMDGWMDGWMTWKKWMKWTKMNEMNEMSDMRMKCRRWMNEWVSGWMSGWTKEFTWCAKIAIWHDLMGHGASPCEQWEGFVSGEELHVWSQLRCPSSGQ